MLVLKFGGKSLSTKEKINNICTYIKQCALKTKLVVVVSAMGDTTDNLLQLATDYGGSNANAREIDALISTGETQSASIFALALQSFGVKAISMQGWQIDIKTMGAHGQSIVTGINKNKILQKLEKYDVVVVAGFQGVNNLNDITTLGRGGSDTTAVALGSVLNCEVEIYSDYNGVCVGDPALLNFKKLKTIDYVSMQTLSNNGAKVLSSASVDIARQCKVMVACKQSSNPNSSGTYLTNVPKPFVGLTCKDDLCEITIISNSEQNNLQKTAKYIINNVKYYKIILKNNKITLLLEKQQKSDVLLKIAKINKMLEIKNV